MGIGAENVNIARRAAGMNVKTDRHGRIRHLTVGHHVGEPNVIAAALHLNTVTVVPVQFNMLNLDVADAVDVD